MISFSTGKLRKRNLFWTNKKFLFFFNCSNWEIFVEKIGESIWWIRYLIEKLLLRFRHLYLNNVSFVQYDVVSVNIRAFKRPGLFQMYQIQMFFQVNFALERCFTAIAIEKYYFFTNLLGIWFEFFPWL